MEKCWCLQKFCQSLFYTTWLMSFVFPLKKLKWSTTNTTLKSVICTLIWPIRTAFCTFSISSVKRKVTSESEWGSLIFEILKQSKIAERLDVSHPFCSQFEIRDESVKKQMGLYEIEHISNWYDWTRKSILKNFKIDPSTKNISVWDETPKECISKVMMKE